jgi:hypothetical protein
MDGVVNFPGSLIDDDGFIADMARFAEGGLTEKQIRKRYRFDDSVWQAAGADDKLAEKIEARVAERIRNGACKRERAQALVADAPEVLGDIMFSDASPKHKIDAAKTLDGLAANGPQGAADQGRFIINIVLGDEPGDVLHFDKSIAINPPNAGDPNDTDTTMLASIATKNRSGSDGGGQQPL